MKALLRTLFFAAIIGGIILFVASRFMGQGVGDAPQADVDAAIIDQMTVERGNLSVSVSGTGTLLPARQAPLVFAASAPVVEILKREGEAVSEGEVIASLDTADFSAVIQDAELAVEAQRLAFNALTAAPREVDIAVAEAALTAAQAGFNAALQTGPNANQEEIARLQVELARNQLWQTQLQSERPGFDFGSIPGFDQIPEDIQSLITSQLGALTGGGVSQTQADISLNQLEFQIQIADANRQSVQAQGPDLGALNSANAGRIQAQTALDRLLGGPDAAEIEKASIQLAQAELALEQARTALRNVQLIAPFDGVIAQQNLVEGQLPPTREPSAVVIDTSAYYIDLPVDETDVVEVAVGQRVTITLDALPGEALTGAVVRVSQTPTRVGQLVTYLARVQLDASDAPLRVGMSATARVTTRSVEDALVLRNNLIRIDRATGSAFVTVRRAAGDYAEVQVTLGARNDQFSEVLTGLNEGDTVVLLPAGQSLFGFGGGGNAQSFPGPR